MHFLIFNGILIYEQQQRYYLIVILLLQIQEGMSRKLKHDQYQVVVSFKTQNIMSISAQFTSTGELFSSNTVQLMRINKDTVIACLERKNQKHLKCDFQQIFQQSKKWLSIVFTVNFDFLPEFKQQIKLQQVQQKDSLKYINLKNMQAQISQIDKSLESMATNGAIIHKQTNITFLANEKKQVWNRQVTEGRYIIRCSGTINNPAGVQTNDKISLFLQLPGQKDSDPVVVRTYHQSGYHFPFFMSQLFDTKQGEVKVKMCSSVNNASGLGLHFVLSRIVQTN